MAGEDPSVRDDNIEEGERMSATTRERPILFSGPMVRAILDGRKTQTRRLVKGCGADFHERAAFLQMRDDEASFGDALPDDPVPISVRCPYGGPGDRLWVRETWNKCPNEDLAPNDAVGPVSLTNAAHRVVYRAGGAETHPMRPELGHSRWRPSIFMPRWASRILLEVTDVRVERLQAITDSDIRAEGVDERSAAELLGKVIAAGTPLRDLWRIGWDSINGDRCAWVFDPWVWVVTFRMVPAD